MKYWIMLCNAQHLISFNMQGLIIQDFGFFGAVSATVQDLLERFCTAPKILGPETATKDGEQNEGKREAEGTLPEDNSTHKH